MSEWEISARVLEKVLSGQRHRGGEGGSEVSGEEGPRWARAGAGPRRRPALV